MTRSLAVALALACLVHLSGCRGRNIHCVPIASMIETPGGPVRAADLRAGDLVTSITANGNYGFGRILARQTAEVDEIFSFTLDSGERFSATGMHPVARTPDVFTPAGQLEVGQRVTTLSGQAKITEIETVPGSHSVVDFSVHPHNNFIADGVLTHNKSLRPTASPGDLPGRYIMPGAWAAIEFTETDGRLIIARPPHASRSPEGDSAWRITGWRMNRGALSADLQREHSRDWLSRSLPDARVTLTAYVRCPYRPRDSGTSGVPASIHLLRLESAGYTFGLPGDWIRTEQIDGAQRLLEAP